MPLYEYKCHKCGKKFEVLQKFSDNPVTVHQDCGGDVEKLTSAPAFHFKGTGWYVTDYAKSNGVSTPASESTKSESGGKEGKSEGGSETKAESKQESKSEPKPKSESKPETTPAASSTSPSSDK